MRLSPYGRGTAIRVLSAVLCAAAALAVFVPSPAFRASILCAGIAAALMVVNFFRDPERHVPPGEHNIIAPADGKIVVIRELFEPEYLRAEAIQVSIFMSPFDVHVNRFPISGTVGLFRHIEGKYLVAFHDKSSDENERTLIGVETNGTKVMFKQIAGAVARRIVAPVVQGQRAERGARFGMIKFGSRVDVIVPKHSVIKVALHDRVIAGETILASIA